MPGIRQLFAIPLRLIACFAPVVLLVGITASFLSVLSNAIVIAGESTEVPMDSKSIKPTPNEATVDFNRDIRPILFGKCVNCHGPDEDQRAADLRLDTAAGAHADLGGYAAISPGDAKASEIMLRVMSDDEDTLMPPPGKGKPLTSSEIQRLRDWIDQGGSYQKHWSYEPPTCPDLPKVNLINWPRNAIDFFTLAKLESAGRNPSPVADRLALARRVSIDLTGLPPRWEDAAHFAQDERENAYEVYVDSLLSKPAFGERWARVWLDLARYADSAGYADDPPRTIWAYRDYVIRALNENKPFDQFTIEQLAGDLLTDPTEAQLVATAFHRNTLTNNEGGTNDEEFRNAAVVDRVNTTMAVWMGTTMACAQCHTHKYDPITHDDYFSFFAFFNSTEDADKKDERPTIPIWTDAQKRERENLQERSKELAELIAAPNSQVDEERNEWLARLKTPVNWSPAPGLATSPQRTFETDENGWLAAVSNSRPATETTRFETTIDGDSITAVRLQTSSKQSSNFVLSRVSAAWTPQNPTIQLARYVRIELPTKASSKQKRHLHVAEVQVFSDGANIATGGIATQSSTYLDARATRAIDGNTDGDYQKKSVSHTSGETNPWLEIDLKKSAKIDQIAIWNRTDGGESVSKRLDGFTVSLLDEKRNEVWKEAPNESGKDKYTSNPSGARELTFQAASADFQQRGFPASDAIVKETTVNRGWAIAPQTGQSHELLLALDTPTPSEPGVLSITLEQNYKSGSHLIDHFRFDTTSDQQVQQWAQLNPATRAILALAPSAWTRSQQSALEKHFRTIAPALSDLNAERSRVQSKLESIKPATSVPILRQLPESRKRVTKIQIRGNYQSTGATVTESTPTVFHPIENADAPTRLDLANWLVDPDNPLTARVIANRHWEQIFGVGIVETSEEFGSQGELPSHPKLLDWLAVEFRESGWDVKHLIKLIVMSSTYRQSSVTDAESVAEDPSNRMLARGPRFRVSAEMVRDQALFVSGLLSEKTFGPPVNPPQPELGLKAAFGGKTDWVTSSGDDRYRRGLYTTWRRSSPYPSMAQFDAPNREVCTVRRIRTNTPLQALVTLNDPVYIEAAQALARKIIASSETAEKRLRFAFNTCLIREPSPAEIERLTALANQAHETYKHNTLAAIEIATKPLGALPGNADFADYAAWTIVANVILNLDEMFMKR